MCTLGPILPVSPPLFGPPVLCPSGTERVSSSVVTMVSVGFSERLGDDSGGVGVASSSETGRGLVEAPLLLETLAPWSDPSVLGFVIISLEKLSALRLGSSLPCSISKSVLELCSAMISQTAKCWCTGFTRQTKYLFALKTANKKW